MSKPHVGLIGLGVMGASLARNIESRGYPIVVHNRKQEVLEEFMKEHGGGRFVPAKTLSDFVSALESPRQVLAMVTAGPAMDQLLDSLLPLLSKGDIVVDLGNTYFTDTVRREKRCKELGINFLGVGVSGGQEGALKGPSIMPGGPHDAWELMAPIFEAIAAKVDEQPCTTYIGPDGSGHFVKMVHNGIEYGDMQLIAEAYDVLRSVLSCGPEELSGIFEKWNSGVLSSFLIEITAKAFKKRDDLGDGYLVDKILDVAEQKGTGKWTAQVALDLGISIPTIVAALDARTISSMKAERVAASKVFSKPSVANKSLKKEEVIAIVHDALYASKIMSYAQGMALLAAASKQYKWNLKLGDIAAIWKGGCIIRAKFLDEIRRAFTERADLPNLMLDGALKRDLETRIPKLREAIKLGAEFGIPMFAFTSSLSYFDTYRTESLPQNLTQAQRDFFGAHTYRRKDKDGVFHAEWE